VEKKEMMERAAEEVTVMGAGEEKEGERGKGGEDG